MVELQWLIVVNEAKMEGELPWMEYKGGLIEER
jgi:hypothetical protein